MKITDGPIRRLDDPMERVADLLELQAIRHELESMGPNLTSFWLTARWTMLTERMDDIRDGLWPAEEVQRLAEELEKDRPGVFSD